MKHYHQGSGLLFTVLTLALFTTLSLVTIRSFIGSSRTASLVQISKDADSEAKQGLAEGMLWASIPANLSSDAPTQYRGAQDATCTSISVRTQTVKPSLPCPYYGFSIWSDVVLNNSTSSKKMYQLPFNAVTSAQSSLSLSLKNVTAGSFTLKYQSTTLSPNYVTIECV